MAIADNGAWCILSISHFFHLLQLICQTFSKSAANRVFLVIYLAVWICLHVCTVRALWTCTYISVTNETSSYTERLFQRFARSFTTFGECYWRRKSRINQFLTKVICSNMVRSKFKNQQQIVHEMNRKHHYCDDLLILTHLTITVHLQRRTETIPRCRASNANRRYVSEKFSISKCWKA